MSQAIRSCLNSLLKLSEIRLACNFRGKTYQNGRLNLVQTGEESAEPRHSLKLPGMHV